MKMGVTFLQNYSSQHWMGSINSMKLLIALSLLSINSTTSRSRRERKISLKKPGNAEILTRDSWVLERECYLCAVLQVENTLQTIVNLNMKSQNI
jgi:hypothetical protein